MGIVLDPIKCFPSHPSEEILEEYVFASSARSTHRPSRRTPPDLPGLSRRDQGNRSVRGRLEGCACPTGSSDGDGRAGWMPARIWHRSSPWSFWRSWWSGTIHRTLRAGCRDPFLAARNESFISGAGRKAASTLHRRAGSGVRRRIRDRGGGCGRKPGLEGSGIGHQTGNWSRPCPSRWSADVYWVRLYGANAELLREFGLSAK